MKSEHGTSTEMRSRVVDGVRIFFDSGDMPIADLIAETVGKALNLIHHSWGLAPPPDCRIYIMTSWQKFYLQSSPWAWRIYLILIYPLWVARANHMWPYSGAWTQNYGRRVAIGIKPPRLFGVSDKSIGKLLFLEEPDMDKKLQQLACHELTHACTARLRLPAWLNEGLAMVTVDRLMGQGTVREDSLKLLGKLKPSSRPPGYRQMARMQPIEIAGNTALGYWLVRYLEEVHPGSIKALLSSSTRPYRWEDKIASELGYTSENLWREITVKLVPHFENN